MLDSLPVDWRETSAKEIALEGGLQTGPFGSQLKAAEYVENGDKDGFVHVVMPKDISNGQINFTSCAKITADKAQSLAKHRLEIGDVLFARRGDLSKVTVFNSKNELAICGTGCLRLRPNPKIAWHGFLQRVMTSHSAIDWLKANAVGVTMPNLNTEIIGKLPLDLPPLAEQQRIAEILTSVDDSIRATEAVIAQAERVKRGLMEDLLTGGLGSAAIARGEVPEGWKATRIDELLRRNTKTINVAELAAQGIVAHYSLPAFDARKTPILEQGSEIKSNKTAINDDCLLFSKLNPRIPRVWRVRHSSNYKPVCSTEFWSFETKSNEIHLSFVEHFLGWSGFLSNSAIKPASSTNSHQRVDRKAFDGFLFPLPPLAEQQRIAEILTSVDDSIRATEAVIAQAERVKRGLMDDLLTGRVRTV